MGDKPGAERKKRRIKVPEDVKVSLYTESGYRCAVPTCRSIIVLDMHHIVQVKDGGGNDQPNLLPLCPNCHALYHRGEIKSESIRAWKLMIMSMSNAFDKGAIDVLLMLDSDTELKGKGVFVSGDGILGCASLISSGYVEPSIMLEGRMIGNSLYQLTLTAKGQSFIENWKNGNLTALGSAEPDTG